MLYMKRNNGELRLISVRECINMKRMKKHENNYCQTAKKTCYIMLFMPKDCFNNGLESANEVQSRTANEREETLLRMELYDQFLHETDEFVYQGAA